MRTLIRKPEISHNVLLLEMWVSFVGDLEDDFGGIRTPMGFLKTLGYNVNDNL